ncbi:MAG: hypothetical protein GX328_03015 [Clostridiaceae bacterium]|nr:hypothetical protein [Clostridiaceae bacterium]
MVIKKMSIKIICFLFLLCLIGCTDKTAGTDYTNKQTKNKDSITNKQTTTNKESLTTDKGSATNKQTSNKGGEMNKIRINATGDGIIVEDLLDCVEMLGKTAAEIGIPSEVINDESKYYIKTYIDGNIFGTEDYGILHFADVGSDKNDYLAKSIWIHVKNVGYDECKRQLSKKFGDPIEEGENPYVEVDGGAVTWTFYKYQDIEVRLSSASQRDYIEIDIDKIAD